MAVVLCHGFNVKDGGKGTTDTLKALVEHSGHTVLEADYGFFSLFAVRFFSDNIAQVISGMTPEGSIGVGHSNGCNILLQASEFGASFDKLIFINPALDNDFVVPEQIKEVIVITLVLIFMFGHLAGKIIYLDYLGKIYLSFILLCIVYTIFQLSNLETIEETQK